MRMNFKTDHCQAGIEDQSKIRAFEPRKKNVKKF